MRSYSHLLFIILCVFVCLLPTVGLATGPKWEPAGGEDGIKVWSLEIPGRDLPGFRGITTIRAQIDDIFGEMLNYDAHTEWMYQCKESRLLEQVADNRVFLYNRVNAPWPVKDRDVVVDIRHLFTPDHRALTIRFRQTKKVTVPVPRWTVRMPRIDGFYRLWQGSAPGVTNVLYQVEVDIGGNVPDFLARRYARNLPFHTLDRLRERVEKKRTQQ